MEKYYKAVVEIIINDGSVKKAVKYVNSKLIVRATRRGKSKKGQNIDLVLTIGKPNYLEREYIKLLQEAKEPFPVKKVQLKFYPKKK